MESRRTRRAMKVWRQKLVWVLFHDSSIEWKYRSGVIAWNLFMFYVSWWMFGFDKFQLLQAILVAVLLMAMTSVVRLWKTQDILDAMPSKHKIESKLPSREQAEARLAKAWERLQVGLVFTKEMMVLQLDEYEKLKAAGFSEYWEGAQPRLANWWSSESEYVGGSFDEEEDEDDRVPERSKKTQAAADKIKRMREAQTGGGGAGVKGSAKKPVAGASEAGRPRNAPGRRKPKPGGG